MTTPLRKASAPSHKAARRRVRLSPGVRRQQILEAALAEFSALGFAATSIAAIARRAGTSKANLYVHFTDKDDIFEKMLEQWLLPSDEIPPPRPDQSPEQIADDLIDSLYGRLTPETVGLIRLLISEAHRVPHLVERWFEGAVKPARLAQQQRVDELIAAGRVRATALTEDFTFVTIPLLYAAVTQMVLPEAQAQAECQWIKEIHRRGLHLLLKPQTNAPPAGEA